MGYSQTPAVLAPVEYGTTAIDNSSPKNTTKCRPLNVIGYMRLFGFLWKEVTNAESSNSANSLPLISYAQPPIPKPTQL
jgi:hypothetical protein